METITHWDDIPSLDELTVDWEYHPSQSGEKRSSVRVNDSDLAGLFEIRGIAVKIATVREAHTGSLFDISTGGISCMLSAPLEQNQPIRVGLFLGQKKIVCKGIVRHVKRLQHYYKIGIRFVDLEREVGEFINGLYVSKVLRHRLN